MGDEMKEAEGRDGGLGGKRRDSGGKKQPWGGELGALGSVSFPTVGWRGRRPESAQMVCRSSSMWAVPASVPSPQVLMSQSP